ncbi:hypothetical protein Goshw_004469, partial [Gossypium schwendimanii]|nr:hypothetical protein [Gossypium schwendimanii]
MDETLKDMVLAMKKESEELKGELTIYKAALSNEMFVFKAEATSNGCSQTGEVQGCKVRKGCGLL